MRHPFDLHRAYVENTRSVDTALGALLATGRRAIRERNSRGLKEITRASLLMLGVKLENRLGTIVHHPGGFSEDERSEIVNAAVPTAWTLIVDIGFRRRTNKWHLNEESLGSEQHNRYVRVRQAVEEHILPIVVVRNRLAHGQWETVLNSKGTGPNTELEASIQSESILTIKLKDTLSGHLGRVIEDLVITREAFERDFALSYGVFESTLLSLERADFDVYCSEMQMKHDKGQLVRDASARRSTTDGTVT